MILGHLDLDVVRVADLDLDLVARIVPARARQEHAQPQRRGEAHGPLGLGLVGASVIGLAVPARGQLALGLVIRVGLAVGLGREEPGEVPARRRQRQHLSRPGRAIPRAIRRVRLERPHEIGLQGRDQALANLDFGHASPAYTHLAA